MKKFSIIIPVYNVEKYIKKCLDSIFNQTFTDFEVIVVDDGCTDKSIEIVNNYNVKIIHSKHIEVSEARNIGVKEATGEYIIFIDSDDYWDKDLLKEINKSTKNNPDLVRFQARTVTDDGIINNYEEEPFEGLNGNDAFNRILNYHYVDSVVFYAIKRKYFLKEKFQFNKNTIHEDFGLTPLIIIKASKVNSITYIGYNYYRRQGSIMTKNDYEWTKRKSHDMMIHYNFLIKESDKIKGEKKYFRSFVANNMLLKITELNKKDYKKYLKELKKQGIYNNLLDDNLKRKIKKTMLKISPKFYYKMKGNK